MDIVKRFLKYVSYETTSDEFSSTIPSTDKQLVLGEELVKEMKEIGVTDAFMDDFGYVYGSIPANCEGAPVIGLIAHMDTAPDMSGKDPKPRIVSSYDGGDIVLNEEKSIVLSPDDFPMLREYTGDDIIVTDGTTLLGADDKAGIAAIISAAEKIISSDRPHGKVMIAFTPDEEIGRGADKFDVGGFGADFAYTIDGGTIGELNYETFNAAHADVRINGKNIHPGTAKGKMKNALLIGMEFQSMLPQFENPMYTEGYEGFSHLNEMEGNVESALLRYIIRDHDLQILRKRSSLFFDAVAYLNKKYGEGTVEVDLKEGYLNMRSVLEERFEIVELAEKAIIKAGISPVISPVRGGTDGSRLSFMGLPCPNIFAGGENMHGKYEYLPVNSLKKCEEVLENIIYLGAEI
ncbi:MAG: peptidase T [Clostridia bacterium]|nr:peptidase T [Clostridia bacterium]MBQ5956870.1 peptidase T [Clostridia bacterium]